VAADLTALSEMTAITIALPDSSALHPVVLAAHSHTAQWLWLLRFLQA
jgi:hypothetical protein